MAGRAPRSRAHRTLLFEYVLGLGMLVSGVAGMTAMQTRMLLLHAGIVGNHTQQTAPAPTEYAADDARSLSASLRVCGDGLDRPVELACWREQLAALLPATPAGAYAPLPAYRLVVDGSEREVVIHGGATGNGSGTLVVADARDGRALWRASGDDAPGYSSDTRSYGHLQMRDPLARPVSVMDADRDGIVDRVYAGDAAGRLWRVDLAGVPAGLPGVPDNVRHDDPSLWTAVPMFTAGRVDTAFAPARLQDRGFAQSPDVVQAADAHGRYDAVLIGSGDVAGPGNDMGRNWLYMVKDRAVTSGLPPGRMSEHAALRGLYPDCETRDCRVTGSLRAGWRVPLDARGEHVVGKPVTAAGTVFFATRAPAGGDCGGIRSLYVLSLRDARSLVTVDGSGSVAPAARDIMDIVEGIGGAGPCRLASAGG